MLFFRGSGAVTGFLFQFCVSGFLLIHLSRKIFSLLDIFFSPFLSVFLYLDLLKAILLLSYQGKPLSNHHLGDFVCFFRLHLYKQI